MNKIFDLSDPIQIHTMFNYLLYKGYLSRDKKFEFSSKQARDIFDVSGANVIVGKAVCRHISAMLTDILNDDGIASCQLGVYSREYCTSINIIDEPKYTKEELINWVETHITDDKVFNLCMNIIEELDNQGNKSIEFSYELTDDKNPLIREIGNHAISFALKDGACYFLDPTQTRIYRMSETNKNVLYDDICEVPIRLISSLVLNAYAEDYFKIKKEINKYPSVSKEEEKLMIEKTMNLCYENTDVFENFYHENSELYGDISNKVLKIKKSKPFFLR